VRAEAARLQEARTDKTSWKKWGPYLSERQWGTVREDYSEDGNAWGYLTHDHARSRAYRWGEDGLAGISDDQQLLCFALGLWNGHDPIIKERSPREPYPTAVHLNMAPTSSMPAAPRCIQRAGGAPRLRNSSCLM
jgi:hypothetical protein